MTRVVWDAVGERVFETGVDRGMLYVDDDTSQPAGVPWNGLISVIEKPAGGEITPYYMDGQRHLNRATNEVFEASIEAFTTPDEFDVCLGVDILGGGIGLSQQTKKNFGFSYRTRIGNDVDAQMGYKIHLVYNAMVLPPEKTYSTIGENTEASNFQFEITTKPVHFGSGRYGSHVIFDSRTVSEVNLSNFEDALYGSEINEPFLPIAELWQFYT